MLRPDRQNRYEGVRHCAPAGAPVKPFPRPLRAGRAGFTLTELLVVIGIICTLAALLLPAMRSAREQANTVVCAGHMRQIGVAMLTYAHDYDDRLFNVRDYGRWTDPTMPGKQIDPYLISGAKELAYWGVPYAKYAGATKELFSCPSQRDGPSGTTNEDGPFAAGNIYIAYSMNGYGGRWSGSAVDKAAFGVTNMCALFVEDPGTLSTVSRSAAEWIGRPMTSIRSPDRLIVVQEGYEEVLDGNGDTFVDWYQWTPPAHTPDESFEWLRHNNSGNVLFADWHIERLTRQDQSDVRYYSGMW